MDDGRNRLPAEFDRLEAPSSAYAPRQVVTYLCTREHVIVGPVRGRRRGPRGLGLPLRPARHEGGGGRRLLS